MSAGGKLSSSVLKDKPKVTNKAASHRNFTFSEVKLSFDFAASIEALPEPGREAALAQFKRLMKEKTTFWIGTDGKVVVNLTAKDWTAAQKLLDDYLDAKTGVGADEGFQVARKNLPAESSLIY